MDRGNQTFNGERMKDDIKDVKEALASENYFFTKEGLIDIHRNPQKAWNDMVDLLTSKKVVSEIIVGRIVTAIIQIALNNPNWQPDFSN